MAEKKSFFGKILDSLSGKEKKTAEQTQASAQARQAAEQRATQAQQDAERRATERAEAEKAEQQRAAAQAVAEREEAESRRLAARLGQQERVESERQAEDRTKIGQAAAEELANRNATQEGPGAQPAERKPMFTPAESEAEAQPMPPDERPENLPDGGFGESIFPRRTAKGTVLVRSLHVRKDHTIDAEGVGGLVQGQDVRVYDTWTDGKDTWVRIGDDQWAAAHYNGETFIQLDEQ